MSRCLVSMVFVVAALALGACGGSDGSAEEAVTETIIASAKTDDPAACQEFFTQSFLEQTQKVQGKAAMESCEQRATTADDANSVAVTNVEIATGEATADAAFEGSGFDGQTLAFALVEEDGRWKLNRVVGFVEFDREKLLAQARSELEELPGSASQPEVVECMIDGIEGFDDATLKEGVLSEVPEAMIALGESCARQSQRQL